MEEFIAALNNNNTPRITQDQIIEHFCFRNASDIRYIMSPTFFGFGLRLYGRFNHNNRDVRVIGGCGFIHMDRYNDAGYTTYSPQNPECSQYAIFEVSGITFLINDWNRAYHGNGNIPPYPGQPDNQPNSIIRSDGQVFIRI